MKRRKWIVILCACLALLLLAALIVPVIAQFTAGAVSLKDQLKTLKEQQNELSERQKEVRLQINELSGQISEVSLRKQLLDIQIDLTEQEIENVNAQIELVVDEIAEKEVEYGAVIEDENAQVRVFKERVREMEENGSISYYSILFQARSFSDLLSRIDFISEIMHYDEGVVDRLAAARERTAEKKAELEDIQAEAETYR
ncbi:MAG: peptidase M23, partial [Oscillospiraceae bacterium]|nr:peptidase M23 [Oscillospiraceae bacterium]